jgi:O-antigen/teichoic acid export membrane protein
MIFAILAEFAFVLIVARRQASWLRWLAAAAALCVILAVVVGIHWAMAAFFSVSLSLAFICWLSEIRRDFRNNGTAWERFLQHLGLRR